MPIRPLIPSDTPAYIALRREMLADSPWAFAADPDDDEALKPEVAAARIQGPRQAIVGAFSEAGSPQLLGAAGVYTTHYRKTLHRANIWGVYITPSARRQGLATALMRATLDHARTWPGVNSAYLSVSENSPAAQRLYERLGFKPWGREPGALITGGRAYDEVHMICFL